MCRSTSQAQMSVAMTTEIYLCINNFLFIKGWTVPVCMALVFFLERECWPLLKNVYPICCGIDVHKDFVIATIAATDKQNLTTYQTERFSTFTHDLKALSAWLVSCQCFDVCMESTGKYWIPVYNLLELFCRVTLAHPQICPGHTRQKDRQERFQMDCGLIQTRSGSR